MADGHRPVYCAQCGSVVDAGSNFCGVCGARVPPPPQEGAPTQQMPAPSYAPPRASGGGTNRVLPLILGLAAVLLVLAGIGAIVGFALVSGADTNAPPASANEPAPTEDREPTEQRQNEEASRSPNEQELGVGDSVETEGVEATLNGVRVLPTTDEDQPIQNPDNRFLAADLTFENVSDGPVSVSSLLEFVLKNEEGYSASQTVHTQQRELAEGEISSGEKASGEVVYEVPPESHGLQLDYTPFARDGTYSWAIGDLQDIAVAPRPQEPAPPEPAPPEPAPPEPPKPEATSPTPEPMSSAPPASKTEVAEAAEAYYQAVDQEDWAYTYANLDASTRALYAENEWYLKNQFFADTENLELATMDVIVEGSASDPEVGVTVYRTFEDGTSIERYTLFVREDGIWKHRFTAEENAIFQPGVPYEDFVASQ